MASKDLLLRITGDSSSAESALMRAEIAQRKYDNAIRQAHAEMDADLKKTTDNQIQALAGVGKVMVGVGLAAAAGVALAVNAYAKFDQAMSDVQAATHETAGNMDLLRDAALDAGAKTVFSANEAAAGIEELAKAGLSTADIMGGALTGALNLAAAGGIGVAEAAELTATALSVFKLEGSEAAHVADLLAATAGKAQGSVSDAGAALNQSALVAKQFGLSIEETTGTLALFASAGLTGSDAGTAFRTMLLKLTNPSVEAADAMRELGINVYDANGQFVGMASIAEQLKTQMSGVDAATRNAALGTIFGSDAIRAAGILYEGGAAAVEEWTGNVNDSGYAAETARIKMDNLKGDLEKLSGAFETALIGLGEAADGPLRSLVQSLTGVVDSFSNLDPEVKAVVLGIAAVAAGVGILGGGFLLLLPKIVAAKLALETLGTTAARTTLMLGGITALLTAGAVVLGAWAKSQADARQRAEEFGETLDAQTGAITANTRAWAENQVMSSGVLDAAKKLGISAEVMTSAYLGSATAIETVNRAIDRIPDTSRSGVRGISELQAAGVAVRESLEQGAKAADDYAEASGTVGKAAHDAAMEIRNKREDIEGVGAAFEESARTAEQTAAVEVKAAEEAADAYHRQAAEILAVVAAQLELSGAVMTAAEGAAAYQQSLDDLDEQVAAIIEEYGSLDEALNDNRSGFDLTTQAGRDLQDSTFGVAKAASEAATNAYELAEATGSDLVKANADLVQAQTLARNNLEQTLISMGFGVEEAHNLANSIVEIPDLSETEVEIIDDQAIADVEAMEERLRLLEIARTTKLNADPTGAIEGAGLAQGAIDSVTGKTVILDVDIRIPWDDLAWLEGHLPSGVDGRVQAPPGSDERGMGGQSQQERGAMAGTLSVPAYAPWSRGSSQSEGRGSDSRPNVSLTINRPLDEPASMTLGKLADLTGALTR